MLHIPSYRLSKRPNARTAAPAQPEDDMSHAFRSIHASAASQSVLRTPSFPSLLPPTRMPSLPPALPGHTPSLPAVVGRPDSSRASHLIVLWTKSGIHRTCSLRQGAPLARSGRPRVLKRAVSHHCRLRCVPHRPLLRQHGKMRVPQLLEHLHARPRHLPQHRPSHDEAMSLDGTCVRRSLRSCLRRHQRSDSAMFGTFGMHPGGGWRAATHMVWIGRMQ